MGQTTILITVDTVKLKNGGSPQSCITVSQTGDGIFLVYPSNPENDCSEVYLGDDITWSGVAQPVDPPNPPPIINITSIVIPPNFGAPLSGNSTGGGSTVIRQAESLMDQPLPSTIYFNINGNESESKRLYHDPKIRVIRNPNPLLGA